MSDTGNSYISAMFSAVSAGMGDVPYGVRKPRSKSARHRGRDRAKSKIAAASRKRNRGKG